MTKRWKRALVTGASSGIGRDLCRELAADGTDLVVVARDERRLDALADELDVDVKVLVADLSRRADIDRVAARLADDEVPVDLLVNNAGFGKGGPLVENDMDVAVDVVTVNATAVMVLSHAAAVALVRRGGGGIVNVSSMAGELVAPNSAVYSATKAFVTSFSESLHQELKPLGVTVTAALPGFTRTEFQDRAGVSTDEIRSWMWQDSIDVAREALDAVASGRPRVVTGRVNKVGGLVAGAAPTAVLRALGRAASGRR